MPSRSLAQHRMMAMVATNPEAAKRLGISQAVGAEFMHADKGRHFTKLHVRQIAKKNAASFRRGK